jgi:D-sedoheptulose 7-phosphate isomerase
MQFAEYIEEMRRIMLATEVTADDNVQLGAEEGFTRLVDMTGELKKSGKTLFFVGNGASAMMSSHMATDFCKNGGIKSMAFNDASLMTALGNDISYEKCFSFPLERFGQTGDMLVTISSSGNSPNVVAALQKAKDLGITRISISGMKPDNASRRLGNLNFYVPGATYGFAESAHQVLLHCWYDLFESKYCK